MTGPGWQIIGPDRGIAAWAAAALPRACNALSTSDQPWRCGSTWFVGVDALDHAPDGAIGAVPFPWDALPLGPVPLHRAQLSTLRPGYPQQGGDESNAAFAFRQTRDAAHLDGLLPIGPGKRRMIREPHAWILGIALNTCGAGASPLVVWEGSPAIMRAALARALAPHPPETWADVDITDAYTAARRMVFATCTRRELPILPGQATLLHRHMLHGTAPWVSGADTPAEGRIIAYFRPQLTSVQDWLG